MKQTLILFLLLFTVSKATSQVHWLVNQDSIPNCELIKTGKFIHKVTGSESTPDYYIVYSDGFVTDYVNGGQHYFKSKISYKSSCKWESEIVEVTIPNYHLKPGHKMITEVIETATIDNLVKIKARNKGDDEDLIIVLEKVEK